MAMLCLSSCSEDSETLLSDQTSKESLKSNEKTTHLKKKDLYEYIVNSKRILDPSEFDENDFFEMEQYLRDEGLMNEKTLGKILKAFGVQMAKMDKKKNSGHCHANAHPFGDLSGQRFRTRCWYGGNANDNYISTLDITWAEKYIIEYGSGGKALIGNSYDGIPACAFDNFAYLSTGYNNNGFYQYDYVDQIDKEAVQRYIIGLCN